MSWWRWLWRRWYPRVVAADLHGRDGHVLHAKGALWHAERSSASVWFVCDCDTFQPHRLNLWLKIPHIDGMVTVTTAMADDDILTRGQVVLLTPRIRLEA